MDRSLLGPIEYVGLWIDRLSILNPIQLLFDTGDHDKGLLIVTSPGVGDLARTECS